MELILIKVDAPEWVFMWEWVKNHPLNIDNEEPTICFNDGETWQYMGSYLQNKKIIHEFRHRNHPLTNKVEHLVLNGNEGLTDDQIEKRTKL